LCRQKVLDKGFRSRYSSTVELYSLVSSRCQSNQFWQVEERFFEGTLSDRAERQVGTFAEPTSEVGVWLGCVTLWFVWEQGLARVIRTDLIEYTCGR